MIISNETEADEAAIRAVIADAFGQDQEATLVDDLRKDGDFIVSLIAKDAGLLCGHVALSRMKSPANAVGLAPVSVLRSRQRGGIGSALIRQALIRARELGFDIAFVLGEPAYYSRFGFSPEVAACFRCSYAGPYFMAMWLADVHGHAVEAEAIYAKAFDRL